MAKYETMMVLDAALEEQALKQTVEKFTALIAENGTLGQVDEWGKRRLAYPIEKKNDGYYVLVQFESEPTFPAELDRIYKITDGVLRSLITVKEA